MWTHGPADPRLWQPPGATIVDTVCGPGVLVSWRPGGQRYLWRWGFRYLVRPSNILKHVLEASVPAPSLCLTKQLAKDFANRCWRNLDEITQLEIGRFADSRPDRVTLTDAQELCFELIAIIVRDNDVVDFPDVPGPPAIPAAPAIAVDSSDNGD